MRIDEEGKMRTKKGKGWQGGIEGDEDWKEGMGEADQTPSDIRPDTTYRTVKLPRLWQFRPHLLELFQQGLSFIQCFLS